MQWTSLGKSDHPPGTKCAPASSHADGHSHTQDIHRLLSRKGIAIQNFALEQKHSISPSRRSTSVCSCDDDEHCRYCRPRGLLGLFSALGRRGSVALATRTCKHSTPTPRNCVETRPSLTLACNRRTRACTRMHGGRHVGCDAGHGCHRLRFYEVDSVDPVIRVCVCVFLFCVFPRWIRK